MNQLLKCADSVFYSLVVMVRTHYESADYDTGNALLLIVGIHINVNTYMYNYFLISLVAKQLTIRKLYSKSFKSGLIRVSY